MIYGYGKYKYKLVEGWAKCAEGFSFLNVCGVSVDSQDRVIVLSRSDQPIMIFDRDGNLVTAWGKDFFKRAHGSCLASDGSIFCTDDMNHTVSRFTPEGKLLQLLGNKDQPSDTGYVAPKLDSVKRSAPPFNRPTGVAQSSTGEIYVADGYGNARVHKFSPEGKLLLSWGEPGVKPGEFILPHSVVVDKYNRVWVCDRQNHRIQIFDAQGNFLSQWGDLIMPSDLHIDDEGTVYVSELGLRVSIFTLDGRLLSRWGCIGQDKQNDIFVAPHTLAVDSRGDLYVGEVAKNFAGVDRGARTIQKFARIS